MQYKVYGQGTPLLYLPGLDGTGELFYRQVEELSSIYQVITFNLRETAISSYHDLLSDIEVLYSTLNINSAIVCGESFGGTLGLKLALTSPHLVESLILVNSFPYFRNRALLTAGRIILEFTPYEIFWFGRELAIQYKLLGEDLTHNDREKFLNLTKTIPKLPILQRLTLVANYDVRHRLEEISCPTLFIASRNDRLQDSVVEAELMAAKMANAKIHILENSGHLALLCEACSLYKIMLDQGMILNKNSVL